MCCFVRDGGNGLLYASGGRGGSLQMLRGMDSPVLSLKRRNYSAPYEAAVKTREFSSMFNKISSCFCLVTFSFVAPPEELMSRCSVMA